MSSDEEMDYPDHTSESQSSNTSSGDTITDSFIPSISGSPLRTRKNTYPKKSTDIRRNRVAEDGNSAITHPVSRTKQNATINTQKPETTTSNSYQSLQTNDTEQDQDNPHSHIET